MMLLNIFWFGVLFLSLCVDLNGWGRWRLLALAIHERTLLVQVQMALMVLWEDAHLVVGIHFRQQCMLLCR